MVPTPQKNLILLRGLARGRGHWSPSFLQLLEKTFVEYKIYYIDIPGSGELYQETTPLKITEFIPYFENQLIIQGYKHSQMNLNIGFSLSLGSMSLIEWATQKPKFFNHIFLINTSARNTSSVWQRFSISALSLITDFLTHKPRKLIEKKILQITLSPKADQNSYSEIIQKYSQYSELKPLTQLNFFRQLWAASQFNVASTPPEVEHIHFLISKQDQLVNYHCTENIYLRWKSYQQNLLQDTHTTLTCDYNDMTGHDLPLEAPAWVIAKMQEHLG